MPVSKKQKEVVRINQDVPKSVYSQIKIQALRSGKSNQEVVIQALEQFVNSFSDGK
jgi:predicted HicB family RNase H-like nuclease